MKLGVLGLGTIGIKLTTYLVEIGHQVIAYNGRGIAGKRALMEQDLAKKVEKGIISHAERDGILANISFTEDLGETQSAELLIECSKEDKQAKLALYSALRALPGGGLPLGTTSSSLSLVELAAGYAPGMLVGLHFFNPPNKMKLVEVSIPDGTDKRTAEALERLLGSLGDKEVVRMPPIPGYIVNNLLFAYLNFAFEFEQTHQLGYATIDSTYKLGTNSPMGPFELSDFIGNDVTLEILDNLHKATGDGRFRATANIRELVASGRLGRKCGKGFYTY